MPCTGAGEVGQSRQSYSCWIPFNSLHLWLLWPVRHFHVLMEGGSCHNRNLACGGRKSWSTYCVRSAPLSCGSTTVFYHSWDAEQMEVRGWNLCRVSLIPFLWEQWTKGHNRCSTGNKKLQQQKSEACPLLRLEFKQQKAACECGHKLGIMCSESIDIRWIRENWQQDRLSSGILGEHVSSCLKSNRVVHTLSLLSL